MHALGVAASTPFLRLAPFIVSTFGNWSLVRVPLSNWSSVAWNLNGVEDIVFNTDSLNRQCVIDNVMLVDLSEPKVLPLPVAGLTPYGTGSFLNSTLSTTLHITFETSYIISFQLSKAFDVISVRNTSNYILTSSSDFTYAAGVSPLDQGSSIRFTGWDVYGTVLQTFTVYLQFPWRFCVGCTYSLTVGTSLTDVAYNPVATTILSGVYADTRMVPYVQVNQEGYTSSSVKVAYMSGYFGDLGGLVLAVGAQSSIYRRDKWSLIWYKMQVQPASLNVTLRAVAIASETMAFAAGDGGTILSFNSTLSVWQQMISLVTVNLRACDFGPLGNGVIVGDNGTVLVFPANCSLVSSCQWQLFSPPASLVLGRSLYAVIALADGSLIIAGVPLINYNRMKSWLLLMNLISEKFLALPGFVTVPRSIKVEGDLDLLTR